MLNLSTLNIWGFGAQLYNKVYPGLTYGANVTIGGSYLDAYILQEN